MFQTGRDIKQLFGLGRAKYVAEWCSGFNISKKLGAGKLKITNHIQLVWVGYQLVMLGCGREQRRTQSCRQIAHGMLMTL